MSSIRGLAELVLWVHDLERSVRFYRDTVGLNVISPPHLKNAIFLQVDQSTSGVPQQIVLVQLPADALPLPVEKTKRALHHIGIEIVSEDFDKERERLERLGLALRFGEHPFLPVRAIYLDDPDGNEVELVARTS